MNILFMADVAPDPYAGASGTELRTISELRNLGHHVHELWSRDLRRRYRGGNLHYALELPFEYRRAMRRHLASAQVDVVHVNQPHGWLAARDLQRSGSKVVFVHRSHGVEPRVEATVSRYVRDRRPLARRLASHALKAVLDRSMTSVTRYADGHVVSCSEDRDFLLARFSVAPERVALIHQAAPDEFLSAVVRPMTAARLRNVLYVAQFAPFKAPGVVAEAMNILARDESTHFTWVCSARHHDDVRALLSPEAIQRLTLLDWMPQEQLLRVYDGCGIFLFGSYAEGFGNVFVEAMARGLCVVATDTSGPHDFIEHERNGSLVPRASATALADAVQKLLRDPSMASEISAAAVQTARAHTWNRLACETVAFYERLIALKRTGTGR